MISKGTWFDVISFFYRRIYKSRMKVNFILLNETFFSFFLHISIFGNILRQKIIRYDIKKNQQFVRYFTLKGKILDIKIWNISRIIDLVDIASSCSVRRKVSKNRRIKENGRSSARNKGVFVQFRIKQNSYSSSDRYISYRELTLSNVPRNKTSGYSIKSINRETSNTGNVLEFFEENLNIFFER